MTLELLAAALGEVRAANGRLNRQLLTAQDDERRRTAATAFALSALVAATAKRTD